MQGQLLGQRQPQAAGDHLARAAHGGAGVDQDAVAALVALVAGARGRSTAARPTAPAGRRSPSRGPARRAAERPRCPGARPRRSRRRRSAAPPPRRLVSSSEGKSCSENSAICPAPTVLASWYRSGRSGSAAERGEPEQPEHAQLGLLQPHQQDPLLVAQRLEEAQRPVGGSAARRMSADAARLYSGEARGSSGQQAGGRARRPPSAGAGRPAAGPAGSPPPRRAGATLPPRAARASEPATASSSAR